MAPAFHLLPMAEIERPKTHSAGKGSAYHVLRTQTAAQACQQRCRASQSKDQGHRDRASQPQPTGSNARQVSGRCWVMGVTSILCLNPLIGPAYWRGLFFKGIKEEPRILPAAISCLYTSLSLQIPTSLKYPHSAHISVSLYPREPGEQHGD